MKLIFTRPEGGELGLEGAVTQALLAAANDSGARVTIEEIREAFLLEVLTQQRRINELHEHEVSTWKKRLNDETAELRAKLEDRRNRVKNMILRHWGDEDLPQGDIAVLAVLDTLLGSLLEDRNRIRDKWHEADEKMDRLHDFIVDHFPKFGDRDPVEAAIEVLQLFATYGPQFIKTMWEQAIRPAIHVLEKYGIDILPKGTIVYGAVPSNKPHKPE
jgi:hypothetical protein